MKITLYVEQRGGMQPTGVCKDLLRPSQPTGQEMDSGDGEAQGAVCAGTSEHQSLHGFGDAFPQIPQLEVV